MSSFLNVFIVREQESLRGSFFRQWLFLIRFFCVQNHLQTFWLWDCIIIIIVWIMWVNWTTMKLIAVRSQHFWNMHSSFLNICTCLQNDSSSGKGEIRSLGRGLEVGTSLLDFLPLVLEETSFKKRLPWDNWHFKWEFLKWQVGNLLQSEFELTKYVNNLVLITV